MQKIPAYFAAGFSELTNITIPNSVTSIGVSAFNGCKGLTSIDIPDSITKIADETFLGCSGLTSIIIPNSVTSIGSQAFLGCYHLTYLEISNSVTAIGSFAFFECSELNEVYSYISDPLSIMTSSTAFNRYPNNSAERTLHVPAGTLAAYQADSNWSNYFGNIVEMVHNGDANGDGVTSIKDVTDLIDYLLGGSASSFDAYNADVNGDGGITIKDVTDLIDMLLGSE